MSNESIYSSENTVENLSENDARYYVYVYWRPDSREPFYIGKGTGKRVYDHLKEVRWNLPKNRKRSIIKSILSKGEEPIITIAYDNLTEQQAFAYEMSLIAHYGRLDLGTGCLSNMTHGGEGNTGLRYCSDKNKHTIHNQNGETFTGTRLEIRETIFAGNHQKTANLFNDGFCYGWGMSVEELPEKIHVSPSTEYELYCIKENKIKKISKSTCVDHGMTVDGFLELVRRKKKAKERGGHCLVSDIEYGIDIYTRLHKEYTFTHIETLQTVTCSI